LSFYPADLFSLDQGEDGADLDLSLPGAVKDGVADGDLDIGGGVVDIPFLIEQLGQFEDGCRLFGGRLDIGDGGLDEKGDGRIRLAVGYIDIAEGRGGDGQFVKREAGGVLQQPL